MIDKFYRLYNPYKDTKTEGRSATTPIMQFKDDSWHALDYKISGVDYGVNEHDVSTVGQTLTRKGDSFVQGNDKYEFLESKDGVWNGKKRKIINIAKAENLNEVATLEQTLTRDGDVFVQGNNKYEFLESTDGKWNAKKRKIENVAKAENLNEVPTLEQTLTRKGDIFVQENNKYEFLESKDGNWNAKKRKINNVAKAEKLNDVPTLEQTLTRKGDLFVQGNDKYEFLETKQGNWDAKNRKITNVSSAVNPDDVVPYKQVPHIGISSDSTKVNRHCWHHRDMRVSRAAHAEDRFDCVIKEQALIQAIYGQPIFEGRNHKIINLREGEDPFDAAVVGQIMWYDQENDRFKYKDKVFNLMEYNPNILVGDKEGGFKTLCGKKYNPNNLKTVCEET